MIATGARWARLLYSPLELPGGRLEGPNVFTPDDIADGAKIEGPVVVYDFDNYYMGSVLAEHLARSGQQVSYVTPAGHASAWAIMSNEQPQIHRALFAGRHHPAHAVARGALRDGELTLVNQFTSAERRLPCQSLVIVGARFANDFLYAALTAREEERKRAGILSSRGSATPRRRVRSCTRSTAGTATRANWTPMRRASRTGAMHRSAAPATPLPRPRQALHERGRAPGGCGS